ncbi:hypothetical protein H8B06_02795 [Sphingobacterium sp. DN00404]|uniref:Na+-driven multidrug efflux pump n=1 Tax=Sphingobacterium micropteri TaxID=2763501 RepID=A0ABR7YK91_9SPHI|nr:MATE family efflux transporter [Sphingobacterium micropteri]MBD1431740.1 hypothetical protein [Sphingobacterium micropteri]
MSTANRVLKNTGFLYAKMGITVFVSLYTTRLILNALGASDFGIFSIVGGAIAMLGFLNASMASATQRFMSYAEGEGNKEKQKKVFNISFVLHILIACLLGIILLVAGYFFFNGVLNIEENRIYAAKIVYASLVVSTMFTVMSVPYDAILNAHENMLYYSLVGVIESFLKLAVALIVVSYVGDKLILYGILMAVIPLIVLTIMRIYCHNKYDECTIGLKKHWDKDLMKKMSGFAGWSFLTSSTGIVSQYGMGIVLNVFFGTVLNAAQGIANQISGQLMTFAHVVLRALNPVIVKSEGSGDRQKAFFATFSGCKLSFLLFSFFALPFILEAPFLLKVWLINVPEWAVVFCRLQLLRILMEQLTISIGSMILAQGDISNYTKFKSVFNVMPIILTWLFFYFGMPPYMLYVGWIICWSILGGGVALFFAQRNCGLPLSDYFKFVFFPCVTIALLNFVSLSFVVYVFSEGWLRLIFVLIISLILNILLVFRVGMNIHERSLVRKMIKQKSNFFRSYL